MVDKIGRSGRAIYDHGCLTVDANRNITTTRDVETDPNHHSSIRLLPYCDTSDDENETLPTTDR